MVLESAVVWPSWFDCLGMVMFGLIVLFEFIDWSFDKDIKILDRHTQLMEQQLKILEKIETRLEQIYIEEVKK